MSKITRFVGGAVFTAVLLFGAGAFPAQAASLTSSQIQSILSLLQSFGADQSTVNNVEVALNGGTPAPGQFCYNFSNNMSIGTNGSGVTALQTALQNDGESVTVNGTFDDQTASAVTGFQEKYASAILTPNGLQYGTGYAGPSTRAKLNTLFGCSNPPTPSPLTITTTSLPSGIVGTPYNSDSIDGSGGSSSYVWSVTSLPAGLTLGEAGCGAIIPSASPDSKCGAPSYIYGTPTTAGTYPVTVTLTSGSQTVSQNFYLVIASAGSLTITSTPPPSWPVGQTSSAYPIYGSGGIGGYQWSATGLPPGLQITTPGICNDNPCPSSVASAEIAGSPTAAGTYPVTVTLTSGGQSVSQTFSWVITPASPILPPTIFSLSPSSGPTGTTVLIIDMGIDQSSMVTFGGSSVASTPNEIGNLSFTVPSSIGPNCSGGVACPAYVRVVTPGAYNVQVTNASGSSNIVSFTVIP